MQYRDVLRLPNFRRLWLGQAISQLGDSFYFLIFMFMVKKITGSDAMVGFVGAVETLPYLLLSLYGGVVADRLDRKKIMLASDLVSGGVLLVFGGIVFATGGKPPVALLLIVPLMLSCVRVFFMPAKSAAIPALVPADSLSTANSFSSATRNAVPLVGLSLSATVMAVLYERSPSQFFGDAVLLDSVSFLVSAAFLAKLPSLLPARDRSVQVHPWADLKEGIRYVASRHTLTLQICLNAVFSLSVSPFFVVYVAANDKWFGGKPSSLAWFEFAFCVSMVLSSFLVGKLKIRHVGHGFIWGLGSVGLFVILMGFTKQFWPFLLLQFACGVGIPFAEIPVGTWRSLTVPDRYRGRVESLQSMVQGGTQPIGMALGGMIEQRVGLVTAFYFMGSGMLLACLAGLFDREFRLLTLPKAAPGELSLELSSESNSIADYDGSSEDGEVPCLR